MKISFTDLGFVFSLVLVILIFALLRFSPFPELYAFQNRDYSLEIYDRNGILLKVTALDGGMRRIYRNINDIPEIVQNVFIESEDSRFYFHPGIDPLAVLRAVYQNITEGRIVSGASTISMQLARIISGTGHGYKGKIRGAINALRLESRLSKKEILELWLNNIPFSFQVEGVAAASYKFLGIDIKYINIENTLILAVIPRSPANMNPQRNEVVAVNAAADLGLRSGVLKENARIRIQKIFNIHSTHSWPDKAPHFSLFLEKEITGLNRTQHISWKIETSLDLNLNNILEDRINYHIASSGNSRITNGAGIIVNNLSGEILAYIGSANFNNKENSGQIDGVQILNQPGSTLKPFLYALAIEKGFHPNSVLPDIPSQLGGAEIYQPMNFDCTFHGPVLLRVALASSMNVPAVYMINRLGVQNFANYLIDLGFNSIRSQKGRVGSGLALGNAEVSLFELVHGFLVFPNGGVLKNLTPFLHPIKKHNTNKNKYLNRIMKPYTAGIIRNILTDNNSRYPGFGSDSIMHTDFETMFKTGTSNQFQNIWALGSSPNYTVGIWMGNFSGNTIIGRTGSSLPAATASEMLGIIHSPGKKFPPVPNSKPIRLCTLSGLRPNAYTPSTYVEFLPVNEEPEISDWHISDTENSDSGILTVYPEEYSSWFKQKDRSGVITTASFFPKITYPSNNSVFFMDPAVLVSDQILKIESIGFSNKPTVLIINGINVGETESGAYNFELKKGEWNIEFRNKQASDKISIVVR